MATNLFFLGIICLAFNVIYRSANRAVLINQENEILRTRIAKYRIQVVKTMVRELGVREKSGRNDGERVKRFLKIIGLLKGEPWCAAFVSFVFHEVGLKKPRTGWSPALFPVSRLARSTLPGTVIGIYFPDKKRIAHVVLIEKQNGEWTVSIEGNTNLEGVKVMVCIESADTREQFIKSQIGLVKKGRRNEVCYFYDRHCSLFGELWFDS